jgi:hypothetical protein
MTMELSASLPLAQVPAIHAFPEARRDDVDARLPPPPRLRRATTSLGRRSFSEGGKAGHDELSCCRHVRENSNFIRPVNAVDAFRHEYLLFFKKTLPFYVNPCYNTRVPFRQEGRWAYRHRTRGGMRWTRGASRRSRRARTVKSRGRGPPTLGSSLSSDSTGDGG